MLGARITAMKGITPTSKSSKSSGEVMITTINYIGNYIVITVNVVILITVDCNNHSHATDIRP